MAKLQEILIKTMQKAGAAVEKIAEVTSKGKAKKPKKTGITDDKGEDFGTISWDERHIHALLTSAERREIFPLVPELNLKRSLHITPGDVDYLELFKKRGAESFVELDVRKSSVSMEAPQPKPHPLARGSVDKLPFKSELFDFILYPSALAWRSDLLSLIPEMSRCIKPNGRIVVSTVHPLFEYLMNPRGGFRRNIAGLFSEMKKGGFFIDELKESVLEDAMKIVSLPTKLSQELKRFQGMPIVLLMRGIYIRKRKSA